ncbi:hypothetical protein BHM03_00054172 [Ensete ventricosum]|nr:hypothetical protein BHM03_00054172 [Ensete ventricosum]
MRPVGLLPLRFVSLHSLLHVLFHVHNPCASNAGSRTATRRHVVDYGRTYVVRPKGRHQATIVWLHGLGDNGARYEPLLSFWLHLIQIGSYFGNAGTTGTSSWKLFLCQIVALQIKWICPTAPTRPVALFGGFPCTAWFDIADPSQDGPDDADALEASAAHIANLLSSEPADGIAFDVTYHRRTAGLSILTPLGFLPSDRYSKTWDRWVQYGCRHRLVFCFLLRTWKIRKWRSISHKPQRSRWSQRLAPLFQRFFSLFRSRAGDGVVPYKQGERSAETLRMSGFRNLTFMAYNGYVCFFFFFCCCCCCCCLVWPNYHALLTELPIRNNADSNTIPFPRKWMPSASGSPRGCGSMPLALDSWTCCVASCDRIQAPL